MGTSFLLSEGKKKHNLKISMLFAIPIAALVVLSVALAARSILWHRTSTTGDVAVSEISDIQEESLGQQQSLEEPKDTIPMDALASSRSSDSAAILSAYATKLREYVECYGSPRVIISSDARMAFGDGVCLAELVDFDGDGQEELLVVYYDCETADDFYTSQGLNDAAAYFVEVWAYSDGRLNIVHRQLTEFSNGGYAYLARFEEDSLHNAPMILLGSEAYKGDSYCLDFNEIEDGGSRIVHTYEFPEGLDAERRRILVDGVESDLSLSQWVDSVFSGKASYHLMDNSNGVMDAGTYMGIEYSADEHWSVCECIDATKKTMHRLGVEIPADAD